MKIIRRPLGKRFRTIAVSPNGHRDLVLQRSDAKVLEDAEERLLRALARSLGYQLVRPVQWRYLMRVSTEAHAELHRIRTVLASIEAEPDALGGRELLARLQPDQKDDEA